MSKTNPLHAPETDRMTWLLAAAETTAEKVQKQYDANPANDELFKKHNRMQRRMIVLRRDFEKYQTALAEMAAAEVASNPEADRVNAEGVKLAAKVKAILPAISESEAYRLALRCGNVCPDWSAIQANTMASMTAGRHKGEAVRSITQSMTDIAEEFYATGDPWQTMLEAGRDAVNTPAFVKWFKRGKDPK